MLTTQNHLAGKETGIVKLHCIHSRLISVPLIHTPRQVVLLLIFRQETELERFSNLPKVRVTDRARTLFSSKWLLVHGLRTVPRAWCAVSVVGTAAASL